MRAPLPIHIRPVSLDQGLRWVGLAWRDIERAPRVSLAHGLALALAGGVIGAVGWHHFWWLAGALTGFLVVAPVLAVGLYASAAALERGEPVGWRLVWRTWMSWRARQAGTPHDWRLVRFGLLLGLAGTGWVLTSAALVTWLSPMPVKEPMDFVRHVMLAHNSWLFEGWLAVGGVLAAPVFASSVITLPLLLDRQVSLLDAVVTSWRVVLANPVPMAVWAGLIMGLAVLGLASLMIGLVLVVPLLGFASWHAYRDTVDASALPPRSTP